MNRERLNDLLTYNEETGEFHRRERLTSAIRARELEQ